MKQSYTVKRFLVLAITSLIGSCSDPNHPKLIVQNQASYDFDCPAKSIKVAPIGNHRYTAEGCFKREVYICDHGFFLPDAEIQCNQKISSLPTYEGQTEDK